MKKFKLLDVANWILSNESITNKKLQKLAYYAYALAIILFNEEGKNLTVRLLNEKPQAWVNDTVLPPLCKEVYNIS